MLDKYAFFSMSKQSWSLNHADFYTVVENNSVIPPPNAVRSSFYANNKRKNSTIYSLGDFIQSKQIIHRWLFAGGAGAPSWRRTLQEKLGGLWGSGVGVQRVPTYPHWQSEGCLRGSMNPTKDSTTFLCRFTYLYLLFSPTIYCWTFVVSIVPVIC